MKKNILITFASFLGLLFFVESAKADVFNDMHYHFLNLPSATTSVLLVDHPSTVLHMSVFSSANKGVSIKCSPNSSDNVLDVFNNYNNPSIDMDVQFYCPYKMWVTTTGNGGSWIGQKSVPYQISSTTKTQIVSVSSQPLAYVPPGSPPMNNVITATIASIGQKIPETRGVLLSLALSAVLTWWVVAKKQYAV